MSLKKSVKDTYVVSIKGDLDLYSSNSLKKLVRNMEDRGVERIIIDFKQSDYIDSSGIGALIYFFNSKKANFCICNVTSTIMAVIKLTKLDQFFTITTDENEAVSLLEG